MHQCSWGDLRTKNRLYQLSIQRVAAFCAAQGQCTGRFLRLTHCCPNYAKSSYQSLLRVIRLPDFMPICADAKRRNEGIMRKSFTLFPRMGNAQGDSFAWLTAAPIVQNHLIIPLLRGIRCILSHRLLPARSGRMDDLYGDTNSAGGVAPYDEPT